MERGVDTLPWYSLGATREIRMSCFWSAGRAVTVLLLRLARSPGYSGSTMRWCEMLSVCLVKWNLRSVPYLQGGRLWFSWFSTRRHAWQPEPLQPCVILRS